MALSSTCFISSSEKVWPSTCNKFLSYLGLTYLVVVFSDFIEFLATTGAGLAFTGANLVTFFCVALADPADLFDLAVDVLFLATSFL